MAGSPAMVDASHRRAEIGEEAEEGLDIRDTNMYHIESLDPASLGSSMSSKNDLTGFSGSVISPHDLARLLDQAGLELWQAPEGFWAIRVKAAAPAPETAPRRRRTARAA
jgi:hypothetical protein